MTILQRAFDFYLRSSIHVALSVFALVLMTQNMFGIEGGIAMAGFAFFGTIVGYNFVKYDALARTRKSKVSIGVKAIAAISFFSFITAAYFFYRLSLVTQIVTSVFFALTVLYTLPFFPNRKNARNWAGVKIYIVSLCWAGVTVVLPLLDADVGITFEFYVKFFQRFVLIFVLILIFEIIDLAKDDPYLQTVPQQIGVKRTKILGIFLLVVFYCLEFLRVNFTHQQLLINIILVAVISLFLLFANPQRSKYYTSFWVESIPVFWYGLLVLSIICEVH